MSTQSLRVILVEDHVLTRIGLQTSLDDCDDIKVVGEAGNGADGLQLLITTPCDVAIVDVGLPDFDGIELLNRYRQISQRKSNPHFLVLTMHDQELEVLSAFASGATSYCVKDTALNLLIEAVRTTGEGHSWIDPAIASIVLQHVRKENTPRHKTTETIIDGLDIEQAHMIEKFPLTDRELSILELIVEGQSNNTIAEALHLSLGTIKTHVRSILSKLCASDRTEAAVRALRSGLVR